MLGQKGGVATKIKQYGSLSMVVFHCPAHRLQLAILDIAEKVIFPLSRTYSRINTFR
jgi:hypothetical protein